MKSERELYKEAMGPMMPNYEKIRRTIKQQGEIPSRQKRHWPRRAVSVLSAGYAGILLCTAVPAVRASITDLFQGNSGKGTAEYISTPVYERPEVENLVVQDIENQSWKLCVFADREIPWAEKITEVSMEEALYDHDELTLEYRIKAPGLPLVSGKDLQVYQIMDAQGTDSSLPCIGGAVLVEDPGRLLLLKKHMLIQTLLRPGRSCTPESSQWLKWLTIY